jgi:toxin ParE1/3/4
MAGYKFFPAADKSQDAIWDYTYEEWGEAQANKYIKGLHSHIQKLADKKLLWRPISKSLALPAGLEREVFSSHYERHYVFFRELTGGTIGIMSILHDTMHIPVRLREDLEKIIGKTE